VSLLTPEGLVCGIDEAGRGPLAGPVVAAAVILDPSRPIAGLNDSKKLSARRREVLAEAIRARALAWAVAAASVEEIDRINILQASLLAMQRAVAALAGGHGAWPVHALVDGSTARNCPAASRPSSAVTAGSPVLPPHRSWPRRVATRACANCTRRIRSMDSIGTWVIRLRFTCGRWKNTV
jgi:ribonuclease HII